MDNNCVLLSTMLQVSTTVGCWRWTVTRRRTICWVTDWTCSTRRSSYAATTTSCMTSTSSISTTSWCRTSCTSADSRSRPTTRRTTATIICVSSTNIEHLSRPQSHLSKTSHSNLHLVEWNSTEWRLTHVDSPTPRASYINFVTSWQNSHITRNTAHESRDHYEIVRFICVCYLHLSLLCYRWPNCKWDIFCQILNASGAKLLIRKIGCRSSAHLLY